MGPGKETSEMESALSHVFGKYAAVWVWSVLFGGVTSVTYQFFDVVRSSGRGLGSVVIGGLALSAVLTLLIIPPLLSFAAPLLRRERGSMAEAVPVTSAAE